MRRCGVPRRSRPSSPRFISDPIGGTLDAAAVVAEGAPPLQGQITPEQFSELLGHGTVSHATISAIAAIVASGFAPARE